MTEAKLGTRAHEMGTILGVKVGSNRYAEVLRTLIEKMAKKADDKAYFVVTAYSEFFLEAEKNQKFRRAMEKADLVVADGVVVPAAREYLSQDGGSWVKDLFWGVRVGCRVLAGGFVQDVVPGVRLVDGLLREASKSKRRVFLLGGWNGVAREVANKYFGERTKYVTWDEGPKNIELSSLVENERLVIKINKFKPDLLLVAWGRFKQEMWISDHLEHLKTKVVIGVGSSFDELVGKGVWGQKTPEWVEKRGLKWLWRVWKNPGHIRRAWNAFPVLAWKIFRSKT